MEMFLSNAAIALATAFFMLWLRRAFLSFRKRRESAPANICIFQPGDQGPDDDLIDPQRDTPVIQVEEFLAELRAKVTGNMDAAVEKQRPKAHTL